MTTAEADLLGPLMLTTSTPPMMLDVSSPMLAKNRLDVQEEDASPSESPFVEIVVEKDTTVAGVALKNGMDIDEFLVANPSHSLMDILDAGTRVKIRNEKYFEQKQRREERLEAKKKQEEEEKALQRMLEANNISDSVPSNDISEDKNTIDTRPQAPAHTFTEDIVEGMSHTAHSVVDGIGTVAKASTTVVSGVATGVGTVASGVATGVGTVASGVATGVGTVATGVATGVGNVASGVATGVGSVASGVGSIASSVGKGMGNAFFGMTSAIGITRSRNNSVTASGTPPLSTSPSAGFTTAEPEHPKPNDPSRSLPSLASVFTRNRAKSDTSNLIPFLPVFTNKPETEDHAKSVTTPTSPTVHHVHDSLSHYHHNSTNDLMHQVKTPAVYDATKPIVLSERQLRDLSQALPMRFRGKNFVLVYSTQEHGISLMTLYRKIEYCEPAILIIKTTHGDVFGAFLNHEVEMSKKDKYYGDGESFVFKFDKETNHTEEKTKHKHDEDDYVFISTSPPRPRYIPLIQTYKWTRRNEYFQLTTGKQFAVGGGGQGFSMSLDNELKYGSTYRSDTFDNEPLASHTDYDIYIVEVYTLETISGAMSRSASVKL